MWLIIWVCSSKVEDVLLAASISFLSLAMLNPSRNSNRNKTSTRYKAIIQFWRHSIANQGESNIILKLFLTKLILTIRPSLTSYVCCAFKAKFLPLKIHCTCTLMFALALSYDLNVWLIIWACSRKVETVCCWLLLFILFPSPAMLNPSRKWQEQH